MMKVLQIVSAKHKSFFQDQIAILEKKGIDCDIVYAMDRETKQNKLDLGATFDAYHNPIFYASRSIFLSARLATTFLENYDLVHVNSGMVAPFAFMQPNRPIVVTLWGDDLLGDRLFNQYSRVTKRCVEKSEATIVRSNEMKRELDGNAHVVPAGVDLDKFRLIPSDEACRRVGWDPDHKHILFPYRPTKSKKRYPVAEQVTKEVQSRFGGEVMLHPVFDKPHSEIHVYMNAADVLLLPSLREGSPNTVKEAMACNLPVVSNDVGDVRNRLEDVFPSVVCQSDDDLSEGVIQVLDADRRSNGRQKAAEISLTNMGDRIVDIYESALSGSDGQ